MISLMVAAPTRAPAECHGAEVYGELTHLRNLAGFFVCLFRVFFFWNLAVYPSAPWCGTTTGPALSFSKGVRLNVDSGCWNE